MPNSLKTKLTAGFTLVELSIVIIIVGLLTAGGLAVGASMVERAAYIDTQKLVKQIQRSLEDYYVVYGRLPCVARLTDAPGSTSFGVEVSNCSAGGAAPAGTERMNAAPGVDVRIGMVPVRTLGLPDSAAADKYGNRIVYAVTEELTDANIFGGSGGGVLVRDMSDAVILSNAAYFLVSPGKDHKGAYNYATGSISTACGTSDNLDVMNCVITDREFRDAPFNNGDVTNRFFDDITAWAPAFHFRAADTESNNLWASSGAHIYSVGPNNNVPPTSVGIGTATPLEKLHVVGNILTPTAFLGQGYYGANYMHLSHPNNTGIGDYAMLQHATAGHLYLNSTNSADDTFIGDMLFRHKNNPQMILKGDSGHLGIGTTVPKAGLHVHKIARFYDSNKFGSYPPAGENNAFSAIVQGAGVDEGGLLIHIGDDNGDEKAIDVWNEGTDSNAFRVQSNGRTGIGAKPRSDSMLTVENGPIFVGTMWLGKSGATATAPDIHMDSSGLIAVDASLLLNIDGDNSGSGGLYVKRSKLNSSGVDLMRVQRDGDLTVYGSAKTCNIGNGSGTTSCSSDARWKKDVERIPDALEKILQIDGIYYRWNDASRFEDKESRHIGVIAQAVQKVFPEAVVEDDDGYLMVGMDALVPPLIESVRNLKAQNDALRADLEAMRASFDGSPSTQTPPHSDGDTPLLRPMDIILLLGLGAVMLYARRSRPR